MANEDSVSFDHAPTDVVGAAEALGQVARLVGRAGSLEIAPDADGRSFKGKRAEGANADGFVSAAGHVTTEGVIHVEIELARIPARARVGGGDLFAGLGKIGERFRLLPPRVIARTGEVGLCVALDVAARPLNLTRETGLFTALHALAEVAAALTEEFPRVTSDRELAGKLKTIASAVELVSPLESDLASPAAEWADHAAELLVSGCSIALPAETPVAGGHALAALAAALKARGLALGRVREPGVNVRALLEMVRLAPDAVVAISAGRLNLGSNRYEIGEEVPALFAELAEIGRPCLFYGSFEDLNQAVGGGQGASSDVLRPAVLRAPAVSLEVLVRYQVGVAGRRAGGLPPHGQREIAASVGGHLGALPSAPARAQQQLPLLVARAVAAWSQGRSIEDALATLAATTAGLKDAIGGLPVKPRVRRSAEVERRLVRVLAAPDLARRLQERLFGQDVALGELAARLRAEALTRPLHQPLRYCAQGTPATGKSASAETLAELLDVPFMYIDAASMPSWYTASAQLLGSGRGIVGSHRPGRLEQAARNARGAVIEIADLDHAAPDVRAALGDLFLQMFEAGEGQSATGANFSVANLVFAFTMNLPGGADEQVRRAVGFRGAPDREEVRGRVRDALKEMLSGAFVSRVGDPILFDPIAHDALGRIFERAAVGAAEAAVARLGLVATTLIAADGLGARVLNAQGNTAWAMGVRALLDRARRLVAAATDTLPEAAMHPHSVALQLDADAEGRLFFTTIKE